MTHFRPRELSDLEDGDKCPCCKQASLAPDYTYRHDSRGNEIRDVDTLECPVCGFDAYDSEAENFIHNYHQPKEPTMENHQINTLLYIENGAQTIGVVYNPQEDATAHTYMVEPEFHADLAVGDMVIVPPYHADNFPRFARVTEIHTEPKIEWESTIHYLWAAHPTNPEFFAEVKQREIRLQQALLRAEARRRLTEAVGELNGDAAKFLSGETK